jgi:Fe-Mn family superoxide dismutase
MANSEPSQGVIEIDVTKLSENNLKYPYEQGPLPYDQSALEPYIDATTMNVHYSKHHKAYTDKFNAALDAEKATGTSLLDVFKNISKYSDGMKKHGGGYFNHLLFWKIMTPYSSKAPKGESKDAINNAFGNFEEFKKLFSDAAVNRFGSGWAWLNIDKDGKLFISSTPNQNNPLMDVVAQKGLPLLLIDVWEHAYYLKYQNRRNEYVENFWNVINWDEVERRYQEAKTIIGK